MPENQNETLGQIIKKKRLQLGMSLRDVAKKVGVHHATIDRIEKDQFKVIDPATLVAIADTLHLDKQFVLSLNGAGIKDEDIRIIARAANNMNPEQRRQMLAMLRSTFTDAFRNTGNDDLDVTDDEEYLDERV